MSTITKEFTKEQLQQIEAAAKEVMWPVVWSEKKAREHFSEKITPKVVLKLARIALASLEAEAVGTFRKGPCGYSPSFHEDAVPLYTAPPAPVVPGEWEQWIADAVEYLEGGLEADGELEAEGNIEAKRLLSRRAAMLQGAEPVTTANKLPDDFDFDRFNDVVWLEAVASNPHMHSPTTSTIAMVALELNRRLETGNSPVISDGWVACSERMPETYVNVLLTDEAEDTCIGQLECEDDDHFCINSSKQRYKATHWMPLPAAPQQEAE